MPEISQSREASCRCGKVVYLLDKPPIMTVACYCNSCQQAAEHLANSNDTQRVADDDGSTHYIMHRKDRIRCVRGHDRLREFRLTPESTTRRMISTCCESPMFLELTNGHWLSVYKCRVKPGDQPPIDCRTMTVDRPAGIEFNDTIPSPKRHTIGFMWRLLSAWIAMGFRTPKVD